MKTYSTWKFILIIGLFIVSACRRDGGGSSLVFSGTVEMTEHSVGARVSGRLKAVLFQEGQSVKAGDTMAQLDRLDQAERDLRRTRRIFDGGGGSRQSVEQAELAVEDQKIICPVDGVVLIKVRETGEVVGAGSPVAVVGDSSLLWVRVYVPEGLIARVREGGRATVRLDGLEKEFKAHVSYVSPRAEYTPRNVQSPEERVNQTFAVKALLEESSPALRPGVSADVTLELHP